MMQAAAAAAAERAAAPLPRHVIEGFRFVARTAPIRALLLLLGLVSLAGMPYAVLMPVFADQILHGGARGLGLLMGASGRRRAWRRADAWRRDAASAASGAGSPWSAAAFGVGLDRSSRSRASFWLSAPLLVPVGFVDDGRDGGVEHADPGDGARRAARPRDGRLLDDVHGHGAVRRAVRRHRWPSASARRRPSRSAASSCIAGASVFCAPAARASRRSARADRRAGNGRRRSAGRDDRSEPLSPRAPAAGSAIRSRRGTSAGSRRSANSWMLRGRELLEVQVLDDVDAVLHQQMGVAEQRHRSCRDRAPPCCPTPCCRRRRPRPADRPPRCCPTSTRRPRSDTSPRRPTSSRSRCAPAARRPAGPSTPWRARTAIEIVGGDRIVLRQLRDAFSARDVEQHAAAEQRLHRFGAELAVAVGPLHIVDLDAAVQRQVARLWHSASMCVPLCSIIVSTPDAPERGPYLVRAVASRDGGGAARRSSRACARGGSACRRSAAARGRRRGRRRAARQDALIASPAG